MILTNKIGDYKITYDNITGIYQILEGEAVIKESKSAQVIEKFLETGEEKKERPKRLDVKAWKNSYYGWIEVVITSLAEDYGNRHVWIVTDGRRSKESLSSLYHHTEHNSLCIDRLITIEKRIKVLIAKSDAIRLTMTKYKPEDLQSEIT